MAVDMQVRFVMHLEAGVRERIDHRVVDADPACGDAGQQRIGRHAHARERQHGLDQRDREQRQHVQQRAERDQQWQHGETDQAHGR